MNDPIFERNEDNVDAPSLFPDRVRLPRYLSRVTAGTDEWPDALTRLQREPWEASR